MGTQKLTVLRRYISQGDLSLAPPPPGLVAPAWCHEPSSYAIG